jgi:hypothetical protein
MPWGGFDDLMIGSEHRFYSNSLDISSKIVRVSITPTKSRGEGNGGRPRKARRGRELPDGSMKRCRDVILM